MKKQIISTLGAIMLTTGALHGVTAEASQFNNSQQHQSSYNYNYGGYQAAAVDVKTLPEYATVVSKVDVTSLNFRVVEDQRVIRKMLLNDATGRTLYKTVFNKTTKQLQIYNTRSGLILNQAITSDQVKPSKPTTPSTPVVTPTTPEFDALSKTVDLTGYTTRVVSDNYNTRVTLFSDAQHRAQYKTIMVKRTGAIKIIRL